MAEFFNMEAEKIVLSRLLKNPSLRADIRNIGPADMSPDVNRVVFSAIDACIASGVEWSEYLVIDRLNSLGIKLAGSLEPGVYVTHLALIDVTDDAAIGMAKTIKQWSVRRAINQIGRRIIEFTEKDEQKKAGEMVAEMTAIVNEQVNLIGGGDGMHEPVDLYGTIRGFLSRDNTVSDKAIAMPFPLMNDLWGYMDVGSCYLYCSRMKIGKSSWWLSMGQQLAAADKDDSLRILVLDTELETWENHSRSLAQISGISEFRIRQGWYRQRKDELKKVEAAADFLEPLQRRVSHCYCGGLSLEELASITRRWAHKTLSKGKRGLVVYDYIKLGGADFKSKQPLFIQTGEKMEVMKNLSKELKVPVMCFAQTNRENIDSKGGDKQQNSGVIGGSDMLAQFASNIYLLSELTSDEKVALNQVNPGDATHTLMEIACRQRGECKMGEDRLVKYKDERGKDRYCKNHLMFSFNSFNVREVCSYRQILERNQTLGIQAQPEQGVQGPML